MCEGRAVVAGEGCGVGPAGHCHLPVALHESFRCNRTFLSLGLPHLTALPGASNVACARSGHVGRAAEARKSGPRCQTVPKEKGRAGSSCIALHQWGWSARWGALC